MKIFKVGLVHAFHLKKNIKMNLQMYLKIMTTIQWHCSSGGPLNIKTTRVDKTNDTTTVSHNIQI